MLGSRTLHRPLLTVVGALLAATAMAPAASAAAQRYASPTGSGTTCSSANPCGVRQAVEGAASGDEVIVAPGDYPLTTPGLTAWNITMHGVPGRPRPRLLFNNAPTPAMQVAAGSTLRYVEVDQAPGAQGILLSVSDSTVDQVIARGTGLPGWTTVGTQHDSTIRNSIIVAPGTSGTAIWTDANGTSASGTFRNVTAIATESGGVAIRARASTAAGHASVLARNVIARGGSGGASIRAETDNSGATATVSVGHSNGPAGSASGTNATVVDAGGNQSATPIFVSAAGGDYREATGSPTIGAGLYEPSDGAFDVDGDPRQIGTTDIGADEFVSAPLASTGPASAVTEHSATLNGTIDAKGAPTSYHFEYGPTTAYGSTTVAVGAGSLGAVAAAATLEGLTTARTYHYRLVATNAGGTSEGADQTFTTAAPSAPPTATPAATPPSAFAGVQSVTTRLVASRGYITVTLACPSGTVGRCAGQTKLTARRSGSIVSLGRATFSIAPGTKGKVKIRVTRAGRRLLGRVRRLAGKETNAARNAAGQAKTTVTAVTVRRRHR